MATKKKAAKKVAAKKPKAKKAPRKSKVQPGFQSEKTGRVQQAWELGKSIEL